MSWLSMLSNTLIDLEQERCDAFDLETLRTQLISQPLLDGTDNPIHVPGDSDGLVLRDLILTQPKLANATKKPIDPEAWVAVNRHFRAITCSS